MVTEVLNLTVESPGRHVDLEKAVRTVGAKVFKTLELFNAEELRDQPEAVSSFTKLVSALCRLSEQALKYQQYHDSRELAKPDRRKQQTGLPDKLVGKIHEQLKLL